MPGNDRDPGPLDPLMESRIDAALRSYAEPPGMASGLASDPRTAALAILERARQSRRRRSWWLWGVPISAAVAALVVVLLWTLHAPPAPNVARIAPPQPTPTLPHAITPAPERRLAPVAHRVAHRSRPHAASLPEQAVFPTPAPLSRQEKALVVFARTAPPTVRQAVINEQDQWAKEVGIVASSPIHPISELDQER
jgi:hypothetical protein